MADYLETLSQLGKDGPGYTSVLPVPIVQRVKILLLTSAPKPSFVMSQLFTLKPAIPSLILISEDSHHLHEFKHKQKLKFNTKDIKFVAIVFKRN